MKYKNRIMTELPKNKTKISWKKLEGMSIDVIYEGEIYNDIKIEKYENGYLFTDYNGFKLQGGIYYSHFAKGHFGSVLNITRSSKNTFRLDENGILHIYGVYNNNEPWEALYSGNHITEVMNSTWYVSNSNRCIRTGNFNFKRKVKSLQHVDFNPSNTTVIDHISNKYNLKDKWFDNRKENLREVTYKENSKNIKNNNITGYIGLNVSKNNKGWYSKFVYKSKSIKTKTKYDFYECILDNLIAQRYLGYKHNEEEFYKLEGLLEDRVKEVENLLNKKMKHIDENKTKIFKKYEYDVIFKEGYCILNKQNKELLLDNEYPYSFKCINNSNNYWSVRYIDDEGNSIKTSIHRDALGFKPNDYKEYNIHIDHLNNNVNDNRNINLAIATHYSNLCNKISKGYGVTKSGSYTVKYMKNYRFWNLIGGIKEPSFKTEQEAIKEVERRRKIIDNARVKLKSKEELNELIQYCLDNNYLQENGLADLDLGYLYWKGILKNVQMG